MWLSHRIWLEQHLQAILWNIAHICRDSIRSSEELYRSFNDSRTKPTPRLYQRMKKGSPSDLSRASIISVSSCIVHQKFVLLCMLGILFSCTRPMISSHDEWIISRSYRDEIILSVLLISSSTSMLWIEHSIHSLLRASFCQIWKASWQREKMFAHCRWSR